MTGEGAERGAEQLRDKGATGAIGRLWADGRRGRSDIWAEEKVTDKREEAPDWRGDRRRNSFPNTSQVLRIFWRGSYVFYFPQRTCTCAAFDHQLKLMVKCSTSTRTLREITNEEHIRVFVRDCSGLFVTYFVLRSGLFGIVLQYSQRLRILKNNIRSVCAYGSHMCVRGGLFRVTCTHIGASYA